MTYVTWTIENKAEIVSSVALAQITITNLLLSQRLFSVISIRSFWQIWYKVRKV